MARRTSFEILHEDPRFICVNKDAGISTIPDRKSGSPTSVLELLERTHDQIFVVHRLDHETSGVLIFAKDAETHRQLSQEFLNRKVSKSYLALVEGVMHQDTGTIDAPIFATSSGKMIIHPHGKKSISHWQVIRTFKEVSFVRLIPESGRRHQLRLHMAHIGHPMVADPVYGVRERFTIHDIKRKASLSRGRERESALLARTALHASTIAFHLPGEEILQFEAPIARDIEACLNQLSRWQS